MPSRSLELLLGAPCRVMDVRVGEVVGVLVDGTGARAIGFDIQSVDGARRFLPWVAAEIADNGINVGSAFLLVDARDSYTLLGARVLDDPAELAQLRADRDGTLGGVEEVVSIADSRGMHPR